MRINLRRMITRVSLTVAMVTAGMLISGVVRPVLDWLFGFLP